MASKLSDFIGYIYGGDDMEKAVYFNDHDYVVANSAGEAVDIIKKTFGEDYLELEEDLEFTRLSNDHVLGLMMEDGKISDGGENVRKTCAEWMEINGIGYLASVDF